MIKNQLKSVLLLGLLTGLLLGVGYYFAGPSGMTIALIFSLLMNFGSYWFSDKIVLAMYKAKEIKEKDNPELYKLVKEVVHLAKLPMPKVYFIPSSNPNAFATGRNPKNSAVAVTAGIMNLLGKDELKGVIAHELSHIKNRDTLIQTIAATIAGVISYLAFMARWAAIFGGGRDRDNGRGFELLALAIITPIIAALLQLALSRSREYLADESAAKILHNPFGLAKALEKLDAAGKVMPMKIGSEATSSLFIVNPFSARGMLHLMSTHPPIENRINKLKDMRF